MRRYKYSFLILVGILILCLGLVMHGYPMGKALAQQPTVDIPTVTSSPLGPIITVNTDQNQINIRSGPATDYPIVGVLVSGQRAPALGRSAGGDWIIIVYPGVEGGVAWVYAPLVTVSGSLPIVEPPPTPTPRVTPTIDPTLAAQFIIELDPTRLPTFTAPPPLILATFAQSDPVQITRGVPMGMIIVGVGILGIFGLMVSFLRGR